MVAKDIKKNKKHSNTAIENLSLNIIQKSLESSSIGIVITNFLEADNPIVYVNPHFEELTGYKLREVVGKNCRFLWGDDKKQDELKIVKRAIKQGKPCTTILRNYRKDGSLFYNELSLSPISDNGQITHFICYQKDITQLIEELKKVNKLKFHLNSKLNALCEHSTEQIWRIDLIPPISLSAPIKTQVKQVFERAVFAEANDLTAKEYGLKKGKEIVGKHLNEFFNYNITPNLEAVKNIVENKFYLKNILSFEKTNKGDEVVLLNNVKPEIEDNKVKWVWGTSRNVTELHNLNEDMVKANKALEAQKKSLENKNIALSEVMRQVEKEKMDVIDKVKNNLEAFILPTLEKLKLSTDENYQLELLRNSIKDLFSEFGVKITGNKEKLTQREIEICNLVKNRFSNKDIANHLNISLHTVEKHRRTVRVKLGIVNKKDSLYTYLNSM